MSGIYHYKHKIELQNVEMAKVFSRIHPDFKIRQVEPTLKNTVMVHFTTTTEIDPYEKTSIRTFGGRLLVEGVLEGETAFNQ